MRQEERECRYGEAGEGRSENRRPGKLTSKPLNISRWVEFSKRSVWKARTPKTSSWVRGVNSFRLEVLRRAEVVVADDGLENLVETVQPVARVLHVGPRPLPARLEERARSDGNSCCSTVCDCRMNLATPGPTDPPFLGCPPSVKSWIVCKGDPGRLGGPTSTLVVEQLPPSFSITSHRERVREVQGDGRNMAMGQQRLQIYVTHNGRDKTIEKAQMGATK